jgi:hypothetical protein
MRRAAIFGAFLLLGACGHFSESIGPELSDQALTDIARREAAERRISLEDLFVKIVRRDGPTVGVGFWHPQCVQPALCIGGGVVFEIHARTGRVLFVDRVE